MIVLCMFLSRHVLFLKKKGKEDSTLILSFNLLFEILRQLVIAYS